jgi:hypothetical protein
MYRGLDVLALQRGYRGVDAVREADGSLVPSQLFSTGGNAYINISHFRIKLPPRVRYPLQSPLALRSGEKDGEAMRRPPLGDTTLEPQSRGCRAGRIQAGGELPVRPLSDNGR